jgi:hypothetical protein
MQISVQEEGRARTLAGLVASSSLPFCICIWKMEIKKFLHLSEDCEV